ncbi:MAG: hypothetical protein WEE89_17975 [Gemmatimonadota bacterium]
MHTEPTAPTLARAMGRSALAWGVAWTLLGASCALGPESTGDVMGGREMWPLMAGLGAVGGLLLGAVYALSRRFLIPFGTRRPGERLGLRGRVIAGIYGAVLLALSFMFVSPVGGLIFAVFGFITAVVFPGDADIVADPSTH